MTPGWLMVLSITLSTVFAFLLTLWFEWEVGKDRRRGR